MNETWDVIIVGAGPGGLACAMRLAAGGRRVLVLERKPVIGPKVCAGGITWDGLLRHVPESLIERGFRDQYVVTNLQRIRVRENNPIIATVDRGRLGQWMAGAAREAGAEIRTSARVMAIDRDRITVREDRGTRRIGFQHLVGADGADSLVRRHLGLASERVGIGINYQVPARAERMEWHLRTRVFGYGYGWIFPHRESVSIGAYGARGNLGAATLKKRCIAWARDLGYELERVRPGAALINFDFQGFAFAPFWLVGDAAGLASGLTGEGIFPAIVSGEAVARRILDPAYPADEIAAMAKKQRRHQQIIDLSARNPILCTLLMEFLALLLRMRLVDFHTLEMTA